eukprot:550944-Pyramimonas_sp.AAC.1
MAKLAKRALRLQMTQAREAEQSAITRFIASEGAARLAPVQAALRHQPAVAQNLITSPSPVDIQEIIFAPDTRTRA